MFDEPATAADNKVPFYKRELSFRRRKPAAEIATVVAADVVEPVDDEAGTTEAVVEEPVVAESLAD